MKAICYIKTLFYNDGPQVIEARDQGGQDYIGLSVIPEAGDVQYALKPVSRDSLISFKRGDVDLRSLFLEASRDEWFLTASSGRLDETFEIKEQSRSMHEVDWLPDSGFFLSKLDVQKEYTAGRDAGRVSMSMLVPACPPPSTCNVGETSQNPG
jgi:hypothetical protein